MLLGPRESVMFGQWQESVRVAVGQWQGGEMDH